MPSLKAVLKKKRGQLYKRFDQLCQDASCTVLRELGKNDSIHSEAIITILDKMIPEDVMKNDDLLPPEGIYLLLTAIYLHDVGRTNAVGHHEINSYDMIKTNPTQFFLYEPYIHEAVADICAAHASEKTWPLSKCKTAYGIEGLSKKPLNLAHLGALLRIADELENTYVRVRGISSQADSPRHLIRFINPIPQQKLIEIQCEPKTQSDFDSLQKMCEYTNKRLKEVTKYLAEMRIYYDKVVMTPDCFIPSISDDIVTTGNHANSNKSSEKIGVRHEYKQQKLDATVIRSVAFSPCGCFMAYSRDEMIEIVTLTPRGPEPFPESYDQLDQKSIITDICFSPDGSLLASSDSNGSIRMWDFRAKKRVAELSKHTDAVTAISFSPKGEYIASGSYDEYIHIWKVDDAIKGVTKPWKTFKKKSQIKKVATYSHDIEEIQTIAFSHNGKHIAAGDQQGVVTVREVETGKEMYRSKVHNGHVVSVRFSPSDPALLVTASDDTRIRLINCNREGKSTLGTGKDKHQEAVTSIALSSTGNILISSSADGLLKIWDIHKSKLLYQYIVSKDGCATNRLAFVPNKYSFATNTFDREVNLWAITNNGNIQNTIVNE